MDGSIAFSSPSSGRGDILVYGNGEVAEVTNTPECDTFPLFDPTGQYLALSREFPSQGVTEILKRDMSKGTTATVFRSEGFATPVCWSPDGSKLLVAMFLPTGGLGVNVVRVVVMADGSGEVIHRDKYAVLGFLSDSEVIRVNLKNPEKPCVERVSLKTSQATFISNGFNAKLSPSRRAICVEVEECNNAPVGETRWILLDLKGTEIAEIGCFRDVYFIDDDQLCGTRKYVNDIHLIVLGEGEKPIVSLIHTPNTTISPITSQNGKLYFTANHSPGTPFQLVSFDLKEHTSKIVFSESL